MYKLEMQNTPKLGECDERELSFVITLRNSERANLQLSGAHQLIMF